MIRVLNSIPQPVFRLLQDTASPGAGLVGGVPALTVGCPKGLRGRRGQPRMP